MKSLLGIIAGVLLLVLAASEGARADQPRRVALVIANAAYVNGGPLKNPANDAALISVALKKAGFEVVDTEVNLGTGAFNHALRAFGRQAVGAEAAVIYYAGHGIEAQGANWLLPVDVTLDAPQDLDYEAINIDKVLAATEGAKLRMVVLDACRDNPFARTRAWSRSTRGGGAGGLAEVKADDVLVIYSAAPGEKALDGSGANSPFAQALARHLAEPGLEIHLLGSKVRDDVLRMTGEEQRPYVSLSISGDPYYFVADAERTDASPAGAGAVGGAPAPAFDMREADTVLWTSVAASNDAAQLNAYLTQFPNGIFAGAARAKIAELSRSPSATAAARPSDTPAAAGPAPPAADAPARDAPIQDAGVRSEKAVAAGPAARGGATFRDCPDVCPEMVGIPAGRFMMGSPSSEPGRFDDESPRHQVTIAHAFSVSAHPITVAQFAAFVAASGYDAGSQCHTLQKGQFGLHSGRNWQNPDFVQGDDHPVVCVNWFDAQAYAAWLSKKTGRTYRLLSEAEYEYVNRAGTATAYWWGDSPADACDHANGADLDLKPYGQSNWTYNDCHDGYPFTSPVGHFDPNPFGLHDTTGNVWSWVQDCYADSYAETPSDGSAYAADDCAARVLRGGSWNYIPRSLRSANRIRNAPGPRYYYFGFRLARSS